MKQIGKKDKAVSFPANIYLFKDNTVNTQKK